MPTENIDNKPVLSKNLFPVVGIGASAGGLEAFQKFLKAIPLNSGMAYVLVQHLDPSHESMLPEILQKVTSIPLSEISDDVKVQPDHIYIIPSNKMLVANDGVLHLSPRPAKSKQEQNLPIDVFFASLAEVHQAHAIGVVLSGGASDGTKGLKAIKDHGGFTFAQDNASAQFSGMPDSAAKAGVVDFIMPPEEIPGKLMDILGHIARNEVQLKNLDERNNDAFKQILALLRIRKGTDFTFYKQTTIRRRILRRISLTNNEEPAAYLKYLREHKPEQDLLYQDLLIPVTSFFRDRTSFENLCETILPSIIKNKPPGKPIRVWVAGCSTGEEAFSIAMCIKEFFNGQARLDNGAAIMGPDTRVQIFATDISEPAISKARKGVYLKVDIDELSPQRLQEFFIKVNGNYQVHKSIRDMCVFAVHNLLKDPPFAKMDLVTCRNVLIYMEPYLQKKALTTFHYALLPTGFLLLGKSETSNRVPDLFASVGKNDKLFSRMDVPARYMHVASPRAEQDFRDIDTNTKNEGKLADFQKTADDILLSRFTPAGVVVNELMDIVHFRGATGSFLEPTPGKASLNLLKMTKEGLAFELRSILHKAKADKEPVVKENIPVQINGAQRNITIEAIPLKNLIEPYYLVLFHDNNLVPDPKAQRSGRFIKHDLDEKEQRILQLEWELSQAREDMRTITEDQEAANEELQSANEELLSGSEELQSMNEEMETSKEELQSTNEELIVINQEMISLNEQVTDARNYSEAIVTTIREPLVILDTNLLVKSANLAFYKTFMFNKTETEGKLFFKLGNGQWNIPELRYKLANIIPGRERLTNYEVCSTFPYIGERIMLMNALELKEITGFEKLILLAVEDITEKRIAENKLSESERKFRTMADFIPQIIWTAQPDGTFDYINRQWYAFTGLVEGENSINWSSLLHADDRQQSIEAWNESIQTGEPYQVEYRFKDTKTGEFRWFLAKASAIKDTQGKVLKWFGSFTEIHEHKIIEDELVKAKERAEFSAKTAEDAVRSKQQFLSNMSHEIRTPMNSIIGFTKVLLRTPLNAKQLEYMHAIKSSGDMMIVLINDILDLAKVDAGKMTFENIPFRLEETVSSMLRLFEIKLRDKNIELITNYDPLIPEILSGDQLRLHQVILNLMSNAVKFTDKGKITIAVNLLNEDDTQVEVEFSIADTGIGIPDKKIHLIFENFQQAYTDYIRSVGGTGLGLTIVKKLLEAQGGSIEVKSKINVGSVFTFRLRFQKTNDKPPALMNDEFVLNSPLTGIKVLVAEDIPLNQLLMKTLLTEVGFEIDVVDNGKMAIEKLSDANSKKERQYDIILMDLQMPGMNGFQATAHIRNELRLDIPIIALSADTTLDAVQKCKAMGMDDYISKPVDEKLIITKIINLLKVPLPPAGKTVPDKLSLDDKSNRVTDLNYLKERTKSSSELQSEMMRLYLEQTPPLVAAMKEGLDNMDWSRLQSAAHKMLASFAIMGFDKQYEGIIKQIQEYAGNPYQLDVTSEMIGKIAAVCEKSYIEINEELDIIQVRE
ncbi:MAG: chemotaxis protein CheB [Ferruginibacter sp.]